MLSVEKLKELGFIDASSDKNGLAYRKNISGMLEVCFYIGNPFLRLQSIGSGFTHNLIGVENEHQLRAFWRLMTGNDLT